MSKEYRKTKRVKPNVNIDIIDMIMGTKFGEVLNISTDGLLVSCQSKVVIGEMFQTQWNINLRGIKSISVGLECLWSEEQFTNFCLCGMHIIDISEDDQNILDRIIAQSKEI
jgi:hypothetical protein